MRTFMYAWNGRKKYIDAVSWQDADALFMERFGFDPHIEGMNMYEI